MENIKAVDGEGIPFLVVYDNRAVFPASQRFGTEGEARHAITVRPGRIYECRTFGRNEQAREIK